MILPVFLLQVEIYPCTAKGKVYKPEDDVFVDDPTQLLGQEFHFKVKLTGARGLPNRYTVRSVKRNGAESVYIMG